MTIFGLGLEALVFGWDLLTVVEEAWVEAVLSYKADGSGAT